MSYRIISPANSFVQFNNGNDVAGNCNYRDIHFCLPVYLEDDEAFQFVIEADTIEEADDLCDLTNALISIGIASDCAGPLIKLFTEKPERFRLSDFQVLYNWSHGLPGIFEVVDVGDCFVIKVVGAGDIFSACSNCHQRIGSDCHTSVIEYSNDENFAGFNYCNSGAVESNSGDCDPTFISFTNASTLTIPYTASMVAKYGQVPTMKVWIYDGLELVNMNVSQKLDTYPPTELRFDFGGPATGIVKIS